MDEANERAKKQAVAVWLWVAGGVLLLGCGGAVAGVTWMARRAQELSALVAAVEQKAARDVADGFAHDVAEGRLDSAWDATSAAYRASVSRTEFGVRAQDAIARTGRLRNMRSSEVQIQRTGGQPGVARIRRDGAVFEKGEGVIDLELREEGAPARWTVTSWRIEPVR